MKKFIQAISIIALIAVLCTAFAACSPSENNANTSGLDDHQSAEVCNHTFGEVETKTVGTETDCVNQVRTCSACSFEEVVEKGEHMYEEVEIAENSATYKCTICNHTYTALVENSDIDSDIDDESSDESSTPESSDTSNDESGDESDESSDVESIPEDNITSTDHEFEYITKTEVAPTCTKDGYYVWTCSCGDTKTEASGKNATGHKYSNWTTTKAATCTAKGTQTRKCSACSKTESKSIAATGHSWDNGKVTTASGSGCSAVGTKTYTCTKCKATKVEQLSGNHTYGTPYYKEWTETITNENGSYEAPFRAKYQKCTGCGKEIVLVKGHECDSGYIWNTKTTTRKGTCLVPEIIRETCPTCGCYWEWEGDYGYCNGDKVVFDGKLSDYTEYTNEIYAYVTQCTVCKEIYDEYTYGYSNEGTMKENGDPGIKWNPKYDFAVVQGDAYASSRIEYQSGFYTKNAQYQTVKRNIKYDSSGYITQVEYRWYDKNGKRYSQVIKVADIPQMFADFDFDMSKYDASKVHFELKCQNGKIIPNRITWAN